MAGQEGTQFMKRTIFIALSVVGLALVVAAVLVVKKRPALASIWVAAPSPEVHAVQDSNSFSKTGAFRA